MTAGDRRGLVVMKESDIAFATASAEEHLLVPAIPHVR